jgi:hypothetical protein
VDVPASKFTVAGLTKDAAEKVNAATGGAGGVTATTVTVVVPTPVRPGVFRGHLGVVQAVSSVTLSDTVYVPIKA